MTIGEIKKEADKEIRQSRFNRVYGEKAVSRGFFFNDGGRLHNATSAFFDPYTVSDSGIEGLRTVSRVQCGGVSARILREVAKKAWIINICLSDLRRKVVPFFKLSNNENTRGFVIRAKDENNNDEAKKQEVENFMLNTGKTKDYDRDNFKHYCLKIVRDLWTIDQISTEIQYSINGKCIAFYAVDSGTIERVLPNEEHPEFKYAQVIQGIARTAYTAKELIVDFANPQTDIYRQFYGFSPIEQAIDLIASAINAFVFNNGNFTENRLPRGVFLVDGDLDKTSLDEIVDYIAELLSGSPANQFRIPVVPSGMKKGEGSGGGIRWQSFNLNNRDMEFGTWLDFLVSNVVALFGSSMEELGLQSQKSQTMFAREGKTQMETAKSQILGDTLSFLQDYLNRILSIAYPDYELEFVGYEKTDPKDSADITKTELESFKVLNEVRKEKGLEPLAAKWADECPANAQLVTLYNAAQQQEQDDEGGGDDAEGEDEEWGELSGGENVSKSLISRKGKNRLVFSI